jgi:hypothetical protein
MDSRLSVLQTTNAEMLVSCEEADKTVSGHSKELRRVKKLLERKEEACRKADEKASQERTVMLNDINSGAALRSQLQASLDQERDSNSQLQASLAEQRAGFEGTIYGLRQQQSELAKEVALLQHQAHDKAQLQEQKDSAASQVFPGGSGAGAAHTPTAAAAAAERSPVLTIRAAVQRLQGADDSVWDQVPEADVPAIEASLLSTLHRLQASRRHQALQRELETLRDQSLCKVCMTCKIDCVFDPCGHRCVCTSCADAMQASGNNIQCPVCRDRPLRILRTYDP